jgi:hypothetical protein
MKKNEKNEKTGRVREGGEGQRRFSWINFFANYSRRG